MARRIEDQESPGYSQSPRTMLLVHEFLTDVEPPAYTGGVLASVGEFEVPSTLRDWDAPEPQMDHEACCAEYTFSTRVRLESYELAELRKQQDMEQAVLDEAERCARREKRARRAQKKREKEARERKKRAALRRIEELRRDLLRKKAKEAALSDPECLHIHEEKKALFVEVKALRKVLVLLTSTTTELAKGAERPQVVVAGQLYDISVTGNSHDEVWRKSLHVQRKIARVRRQARRKELELERRLDAIVDELKEKRGGEQESTGA